MGLASGINLYGKSRFMSGLICRLPGNKSRSILEKTVKSTLNVS